MLDWIIRRKFERSFVSGKREFGCLFSRISPPLRVYSAQTAEALLESGGEVKRFSQKYIFLTGVLDFKQPYIQ